MTVVFPLPYSFHFSQLVGRSIGMWNAGENMPLSRPGQQLLHDESLFYEADSLTSQPVGGSIFHKLLPKNQPSQNKNCISHKLNGPRSNWIYPSPEVGGTGWGATRGPFTIFTPIITQLLRLPRKICPEAIKHPLFLPGSGRKNSSRHIPKQHDRKYLAKSFLPAKAAWVGPRHLTFYYPFPEPSSARRVFFFAAVLKLETVWENICTGNENKQ